MTSSDFADVVVVGDGVVGLACAHAAAARGLDTCLVGRRRAGLASTAAAGFLAPTIDPVRGDALHFTLAARERYRVYLDDLRRITGRAVPFALEGILRLPSSDREAATFAAAVDTMSRWVSAAEVSELEPALHAPFGARWHPDDGMVDNQHLLRALDDALALGAAVRLEGDVDRIELMGELAELELHSGQRIRCRHLVLAAGAWAPDIAGLPRALPVRPIRGQMMALAGAPHVGRPVFGFGGYLVPRAHERETIVGSTSEAVGFTVGTTDAALAQFRHVAAAMVPPLARADELRTWSGFRPMTLDGLPIIGPDPDFPALLYACGHSRNGNLLAPLTGDVIAALAAGDTPAHSLAPFSISRFSGMIRPES